MYLDEVEIARGVADWVGGDENARLNSYELFDESDRVGGIDLMTIISRMGRKT